MLAKTVKPPSYRMECAKKKLSEADRNDIFSYYWSSEKENNVKCQFIVSCVENKPTASTRKNAVKSKANTLTYKLFLHNAPVTVCKTMFLNTLAISKKTVITALQKRWNGGIVEEDRRGKCTSTAKTPSSVQDGVIEHISSFPAYDSHYRESCQKKFLSPDLSVERMYSYKLYLKQCAEKKTLI